MYDAPMQERFRINLVYNIFEALDVVYVKEKYIFNPTKLEIFLNQSPLTRTLIVA